MSDDKHYFAVWARDRANALEARLKVRERHRERLREGAPGLRVVHGGPTLSGEGRMAGTLLVVEAVDIEAVRAFVAQDPYVAAGVYDLSTLEIVAWQWGLGRPD
jgi:uncharacterized protein YciI